MIKTNLDMEWCIKEQGLRWRVRRRKVERAEIDLWLKEEEIKEAHDQEKSSYVKMHKGKRIKWDKMNQDEEVGERKKNSSKGSRIIKVSRQTIAIIRPDFQQQ